MEKLRNHNNNPNPDKKNNAKSKKSGNKEGDLTHQLLTCAKSGDASAALSTFSAATAGGLRPSSVHFNTLFHLLSSRPSLDETLVSTAFDLFDQMLSYNIPPNESTVTSMARIACQKSDGGDSSFELVKTMRDKLGISPRLRTYAPCLSFFCERLQADKAFEVEEHMGKMGISLEENEMAKLLQLSSKIGNGDKMYEYMHKLRNLVSKVQNNTAKVIESWFESEKASELASCENFEQEKVRDVILQNGGGYFGKGWIGRGKWEVKRGKIGNNGICNQCGEKLKGVDLGEIEREEFMKKVASLATERESKANFVNFQEWLEKNDNYEVIIDAANVAFYQQNFSDGGFSLSQIDRVVREMKKQSNDKWPLILLHKRRVVSLSENSENREIIETWKNENALYITPTGSNDDWYWLYAAIRLKGLLVTNDEMRDHIFELLGSSFFSKWKERHQVKYTFNKGNLVLVMPPSYSSVIQESEKGSWHVPIDDKCAAEIDRSWLCITRRKEYECYNDESCKNDDSSFLNTCDGGNKSGSVIGKRKERS
ncbi:hypothetical protein LUZ60_015767 [Juncus effusus]|nr:hypothetical protein LUZ60_015767 [Juncus effusus]